jgi:hypothetical protein
VVEGAGSVLDDVGRVGVDAGSPSPHAASNVITIATTPAPRHTPGTYRSVIVDGWRLDVTGPTRPPWVTITCGRTRMNMLNSAKKFAMKNKEKIAAGVDKATDVIDKKTGGKHADKLKKVDDAAAKFSGKPAADEPPSAPPSPDDRDEPPAT